MEHLAALQEGYDGVRNDNAHIGEHLTALQTDHDKVREHFAALQEDQTALRGTVAELVEGAESHRAALKRIDGLWADLHRDMTALADALSRREEG